MPFQSRCMVYATEKEDDDGDRKLATSTTKHSGRKLASIFEETKQMMVDWAQEAGIDLSIIDEARERE